MHQYDEAWFRPNEGVNAASLNKMCNLVHQQYSAESPTQLFGGRVLVVDLPRCDEGHIDACRMCVDQAAPPTVAEGYSFTGERKIFEERATYTKIRLRIFTPAGIMAKEDLFHLSRLRRVALTPTAIWKMSLQEMQKVIGDQLTAEEECCIAQKRIERSQGPESRMTIKQLKELMGAEGVSCSTGMTKGGMVDALFAARRTAAANPHVRMPRLDELDPKQREVVEFGASLPLLKSRGHGVPEEVLISAGPGAGKTTTLVNMIAETVKRNETARVLVVAFNVEAENTLKKRLGRIIPKNKLILKTKVMDVENKGCAVLTFDKLAAQIGRHQTTAGFKERESMIGASKERDGEDPYRKQKELAASLLRTGKVVMGTDAWDIVVVDEAQDVTALESGIIDEIVKQTNAVVIAAGDPRQEVYPAAEWYSAHWSTSVLTRNDKISKRYILANNYRSAPEIVDALNAYSRAAFPTLHHDQIAVRKEAGKVRILEVEWKDSVAETNREIGRQVGSILSKSAAGKGYGLVPVTLTQFKVDSATTAARQILHELEPSELTVSLTGATSVPEGEVFLLATSRRIKGTERPLVVAYGIDRDYDLLVDNAAMAKLIFVALSRARDELVLVTQKLTTQRIKVLLEPFIAANLENGGSGVVTADPVERPRRMALNPIPVTGETLVNAGGTGVCQIPYPEREEKGRPWTSKNYQLEALPDLHVSHKTIAYRDFVGCLAEAFLAQALQVEDLRKREELAVSSETCTHPALADPKHLQIVVDRQKTNHGLYFEKDQPILCTSAEYREQLDKLITECSQSHDGSSAAPYMHAMLKFTAYCGKPWTVSEELAGPEFSAKIGIGASKVAEQLVTIMFSLYANYVEPTHAPPPLFWTRGGWIMSPSRSTKEETRDFQRENNGACVSFETDARYGNIPIEFKYTGELTEEHKRQVLSYMVMLKSPVGVLYNGRDGQCVILYSNQETVPYGLSEPNATYSGMAFNNNARALLALRTGRSSALQHLSPYVIAQPQVLAHSKATVGISVDVENDEQGLTTEIGAVAVSLVDWSILGTFQRQVATHISHEKANRSAWSVERITHLRRANGVLQTMSKEAQDERKALHALESAALESSFHQWSAALSEVPPLFFHWAGSEKELVTPVGLLMGSTAPVETLDVYSRCFRPWLEHKAKDTARKGNSSLSDAKNQLLPQLPFVAHQAFEDALMTLAVFLATVKIGGCV